MPEITSEITESASIIGKSLVKEIGKIIRGKDNLIFNLITALISGGHVLIEDYPGSGKTTLAKCMSRCIIEDKSTPIKFRRVQFTPDLLPSDIIGVNIYLHSEGRFEFQAGPVFSNILLADEINRAGPKVQSALLESMAERQVTVDKKTYLLDDIFFVIATENPLEMAGTYPLPQVQLDRFLFKLRMGYVGKDHEKEILRNYGIIRDIDNIDPVCTKDDILNIRTAADSVHVSEEILDFITSFTAETRRHPAIKLGASTRSAIYFMQSARVRALLLGRSFVIEDDLKALTEYIFPHRMIFNTSEKEGINIVRDLTEQLISQLFQSRVR